MQVCVNGEPALSLEPIPSTDQRSIIDRNSLRKPHHSAGQISSLSIHEFLALPANAALGVRIQGSGKSQGFLSIRKL